MGGGGIPRSPYQHPARCRRWVKKKKKKKKKKRTRNRLDGFKRSVRPFVVSFSVLHPPWLQPLCSAQIIQHRASVSLPPSFSLSFFLSLSLSLSLSLPLSRSNNSLYPVSIRLGKVAVKSSPPPPSCVVAVSCCCCWSELGVDFWTPFPRDVVSRAVGGRLHNVAWIRCGVSFCHRSLARPREENRPEQRWGGGEGGGGTYQWDEINLGTEQTNSGPQHYRALTFWTQIARNKIRKVNCNDSLHWQCCSPQFPQLNARVTVWVFFFAWAPSKVQRASGIMFSCVGGGGGLRKGPITGAIYPWRQVESILSPVRSSSLINPGIIGTFHVI